DACAATADGGAAAECDKRDSYPEGVAACGSSAIGKWIEGDVDLVVEVEVSLPGEEGHEEESRRVDVLPRSEIKYTLAMAPFSGVQHQATVGNCTQDFAPARQCRDTDLAEIVETSEGDLSAD